MVTPSIKVLFPLPSLESIATSKLSQILLLFLSKVLIPLLGCTMIPRATFVTNIGFEVVDRSLVTVLLNEMVILLGLLVVVNRHATDKDFTIFTPDSFLVQNFTCRIGEAR